MTPGQCPPVRWGHSQLHQTHAAAVLFPATSIGTLDSFADQERIQRFSSHGTEDQTHAAQLCPQAACTLGTGSAHKV